MPRNAAAETGTTVLLNGQETTLYRVGSIRLDRSTDTVTIQGVSLRRELEQNQVKVRPTNVTAVLYFVETDTATSDPLTPSVIDEIIVLQNGPKGGFTQFPITTGRIEVETTDYDEVHIYANGVVNSVYTA